MTALLLRLHPDSRSPIKRIEVTIACDAAGLLRLTFFAFGDLDRVAIPPARSPAFADELWRHSCFEAFVGAGDGYYEVNLSPSSEWAAYRFDGYRAGMGPVAIADPSIAWQRAAGEGQMDATLVLPADASGPLGLSAVIEDKDGGKSYWALAFPPGKPDFHHAACFAAELPPAG